MKETNKETTKQFVVNAGKAVLNYVLDLQYPRRSPVCEGILGKSQGRICASCKKNLPYIREPLCKKCGKQLAKEEQEYCADCVKTDHLFTCGRAVFLYEKELRRSVHRMKFQNHREYLDFYAEEMARPGEKYLCVGKPKVILPAPMNRKKRRERGFDQSVLLARKLSILTGIPLDEKSLIRTRYTMPQKELSAKERKSNLKDAFMLDPDCDIQELVMLVDHIYTTGSTMDAISRALRKRGIREIYFLILCAGRSKN